jgi:hypothetical protein
LSSWGGEPRRHLVVNPTVRAQSHGTLARIDSLQARMLAGSLTISATPRIRLPPDDRRARCRWRRSPTSRLDARGHTHPRLPNALNGVQVANTGPIERIATAVDFSSATSEGQSRPGRAPVVHHGMFWGGAQTITGHRYERRCAR